MKNTTGKKLTVNFNLRLWDASGSSSLIHGSIYCSSLDGGYTIEAADAEWHYYELELTNLPDTLNSSFSPAMMRMSVAAGIENAAVGDTFYIDSFDIYHGSRV